MDSFLETMRGISRRSSRSGVMDMQIRPRPWVAMKLMLSGVTRSAAMVKSPSFSRSSSSTTMIILPSQMSSMALSMESRLMSEDNSYYSPYFTGGSRRSQRSATWDRVWKLVRARRYLRSVYSRRMGLSGSFNNTHSAPRSSSARMTRHLVRASIQTEPESIFLQQFKLTGKAVHLDPGPACGHELTIGLPGDPDRHDPSWTPSPHRVRRGRRD